MLDFDTANQKLSSYIDTHIPSIKAAGIQLVSIDNDTLTLSAPLNKNHNEFGIAFGASLYQLSMMACWSALYLKCDEHFERPNILTRDGQIRYRHPCNDDFVLATCKLPNQRQWDGFFAHFEKTGKTSLTLTSTIMSEKEIAVYFDGVFVLLDEKNG